MPEIENISVQSDKKDKKSKKDKKKRRKDKKREKKMKLKLLKEFSFPVVSENLVNMVNGGETPKSVKTCMTRIDAEDDSMDDSSLSYSKTEEGK